MVQVQHFLPSFLGELCLSYQVSNIYHTKGMTALLFLGYASPNVSRYHLCAMTPLGNTLQKVYTAKHHPPDVLLAMAHPSHSTISPR